MYEDKSIDKRKHLSVLLSESSFISHGDEEYYSNMVKVKPKLKTLDDCIQFYNDWVNTYRQVKKYWDKGDSNQ